MFTRNYTVKVNRIGLTSLSTFWEGSNNLPKYILIQVWNQSLLTLSNRINERKKVKQKILFIKTAWYKDNAMFCMCVLTTSKNLNCIFCVIDIYFFEGF